jgi:hypothetical protein
MKSTVGVVGDELQQAHRLILRCEVRAGGLAGPERHHMRVTFTAEKTEVTMPMRQHHREPAHRPGAE